jgi:hypothetical protein
MDHLGHAVTDPGTDPGADRRPAASDRSPAVEALRRFLRATVDELSTNPLWRRLMTHPEEMRAVARKLDPERVTATADNHVTALADFVAHNRQDGELIDADPAVIIGVLQTVLLVPMNAERLGDPALHPKILDLLIDIVATGLTAQRE